MSPRLSAAWSPNRQHDRDRSPGYERQRSVPAGSVPAS